MVLDIKMCRFDNVPWGFRLVGGADYEYPLTVVKVVEGSIAEEAGLCVEDVIVRINDTAATPLTHDEAHRLILSSGSVFYFGVYREHEECDVEVPKRFPISSASSMTKSPTPLDRESPLPSLLSAEAAKALVAEEEEEQVELLEECRSDMTEMHADELQPQPVSMPDSEKEPQPLDSLYLPDLPDRPCSALSEQTEIKLVEEEIAAVLSGESEVLKEHNVLGVNFNRIMPKPGVCMTSDVLRSLNEEVTKTKQEKEQENRKWSTFLQRPDRPVPKSKQQLEAERRAANAYKVKIVKSVPREKSPMEPQPDEEQQKPTEDNKEDEIVIEAVEEPEPEPLPTDSEVPNLLQLPDNGNNLPEDTDAEQLEKTDATKEQSELQKEHNQPTASGRQEGEEDNKQEVEEEEQAGLAEPKSAPAPTIVKTEEELALEKQLCDVQRQLAALSSLPSTIQSTLDAVTKQLAELLPTFKLQQQQQDQLPLPQIDEAQRELEEEQKEGGVGVEEGGGAAGQPGQLAAAGENEGTGTEVATALPMVATVATVACENNEDKCDANDLEVAEISHSNGDDNRELDEPNNPELAFKKQKIAFWNRLFNGEHITRQRFRELQSLSVSQTVHRVNFMKYQKPERKIDLNRSEVYKIVHHLDRSPLHGIEVRAPLVAAESDIRQALQS